MAHPYADKMQGSARAKAMCKADGGPIGGAMASGFPDRRVAPRDMAQTAQQMGNSGVIKQSHADWVSSKIKDLGK